MLGPSNGGNGGKPPGKKGLLGAMLKDTNKRNVYKAGSSDEKTQKLMTDQALGSLAKFANNPTSSNSTLQGAGVSSTKESSDKNRGGGRTASRISTVPVIREKAQERKSALKYSDDDDDDFFRR